MSNLAIIPARGGSKRINKKNIKYFFGKPIISYSIETAINSNLFDEVMVSTDDLEIEKIAISYGASVPFIRSKINSNDFATTIDVLIEVLDKYQKKGVEFENICCIYPTAPFITIDKLVKGFNLLNNDIDSVIPVLNFDHSIWRSFSLDENEYLKYNWSEFTKSRSQDLIPTFHDAGQWYWFKWNKFKESRKLIFEKTKALHLSTFEAHDIDTLDDWKLAELKYEYLQSLK